MFFELVNVAHLEPIQIAACFGKCNALTAQRVEYGFDETIPENMLGLAMPLDAGTATGRNSGNYRLCTPSAIVGVILPSQPAALQQAP